MSVCVSCRHKIQMPCKHFPTQTKPGQTKTDACKSEALLVSCAQNIIQLKPDRFLQRAQMWGLVAVQAVRGWVSSAADGWAGAPLPGSSCAYSHLAPHLIHFLPDGPDSNRLHGGTHLSGEINLSVLLAKLFESSLPQRPNFNLCSDACTFQ